MVSTVTFPLHWTVGLCRSGNKSAASVASPGSAEFQADLSRACKSSFCRAGGQKELGTLGLQQEPFHAVALGYLAPVGPTSAVPDAPRSELVAQISRSLMCPAEVFNNGYFSLIDIPHGTEGPFTDHCVSVTPTTTSPILCNGIRRPHTLSPKSSACGCLPNAMHLLEITPALILSPRDNGGCR